VIKHAEAQYESHEYWREINQSKEGKDVDFRMKPKATIKGDMDYHV
jgi:hypothetical protein